MRQRVSDRRDEIERKKSAEKVVELNTLVNYHFRLSPFANFVRIYSWKRRLHVQRSFHATSPSRVFVRRGTRLNDKSVLFFLITATAFTNPRSSPSYTRGSDRRRFGRSFVSRVRGRKTYENIRTRVHAYRDVR